LRYRSWSRSSRPIRRSTSLRASPLRGRGAVAWLLGGAFAMGMGIWSMHFIGMLAFSLPIPMAYDVGTTWGRC
jgi:NO-binding membrane sensor protein with MHYT domain